MSLICLHGNIAPACPECDSERADRGQPWTAANLSPQAQAQVDALYELLGALRPYAPQPKPASGHKPFAGYAQVRQEMDAIEERIAWICHTGGICCG